MRIALANDHPGTPLKNEIAAWLHSQGHEVVDFGTFDETIGGILPRTPGSLAPFAERIRDFCVAKDFICQNSLDLDEKGHVAYFKNGMQQQGADFALDLIRQSALAPTVPQPAETPEAPADAAQQ